MNFPKNFNEVARMIVKGWSIIRKTRSDKKPETLLVFLGALEGLVMSPRNLSPKKNSTTYFFLSASNDRVTLSSNVFEHPMVRYGNSLKTSSVSDLRTCKCGKCRRKIPVIEKVDWVGRVNSEAGWLKEFFGLCFSCMRLTTQK